MLRSDYGCALFKNFYFNSTSCKGDLLKNFTKMNDILQFLVLKELHSIIRVQHSVLTHVLSQPVMAEIMLYFLLNLAEYSACSMEKIMNKLKTKTIL